MSINIYRYYLCIIRGEFSYTRLVATRKKLTYVGNHDGEVHDTVGILASGQVLGGSGAGVGGIKSVDIGSGGGDGLLGAVGSVHSLGL